MNVRISGKQVDLGASFQGHAENSVEAAVSKYFAGGYQSNVVVEKDGSVFQVECNIHLDSGMDLQSTGSSHDVYPAFEQAMDRIEKRLRRYKRRLKSHRAQDRADMVGSFVLASPADDDVELPEEDAGPAIIAESQKAIRTMSVSTAVMAMDLSGEDVYVFRNPDSGELNILHKRSDGNIGWIDPALQQGA